MNISSSCLIIYFMHPYQKLNCTDDEEFKARQSRQYSPPKEKMIISETALRKNSLKNLLKRDQNVF